MKSLNRNITDAFTRRSTKFQEIFGIFWLGGLEYRIKRYRGFDKGVEIILASKSIIQLICVLPVNPSLIIKIRDQFYDLI